jgi:hypothetical protein
MEKVKGQYVIQSDHILCCTWTDVSYALRLTYCQICNDFCPYVQVYIHSLSNACTPEKTDKMTGVCIGFFKTCNNAGL